MGFIRDAHSHYLDYRVCVPILQAIMDGRFQLPPNYLQSEVGGEGLGLEAEGTESGPVEQGRKRVGNRVNRLSSL